MEDFLRCARVKELSAIKLKVVNANLNELHFVRFDYFLF